MLLDLIKFELRLHSRQTLYRVACFAFLVMGIVFANGTPGAGLQKDSPFALVFLTSILSMGSVIAIAIFSGIAILRDSDSKMEGIIYATNLTHSQFVLSRFIGLVLATFFCFSLTTVGLYLAHFMPWSNPELMSNYNPLGYIYSLFVVGLPNILLGSSIIFATAALTRNNMATYLSGVFLYVIYWIGSMIGKSPLLAANSFSQSENADLASLLEPYGLLAYMDQTRYWSPAQKNTQIPQLVDFFLYNRLFWLAIALIIFALTYRFFSFRVLNTRTKAKKEVKEKNPITPIPFRSIQPITLNVAAHFRIWISQVGMNFKTIVKGVPFYALLLLWTLLIVISVLETLRSSMGGVPYQPLTGLFLPGVMEGFLVLGTMVVIFYAFELLHHERSHNFDGIYHSTPTSNLTFLLGKLGALALLILTLIAYAVMISVTIQTAKGATSYDFPLYASLIYRIGGPLICIAALSLFIGNFIPNKYAGMGLTFLYTIPFSGVVLGKSSIFEHPMLRFGYTPKFEYSPMIGAAYYDKALFWFLLFWFGISGFLLTIALRYWRRGASTRATKLGSGGFALAITSLLLTLGAGAYLVNAFHFQNTYRNQETQRDWQAQYERLYGKYEHTDLPRYSNADLQIDLYPDKSEYTIKGALTIHNATKEPISELLLGISDQVTRYTYTIANTTQQHDAEYNHTWLHFDSPLQPGQERILEIDLYIQRGPFSRLDAENYIFPNYTYIEPDKMLPFFGFNHGNLLINPRARAKRNLPERKQYPTEDEHGHEDNDYITYRILASTKESQQIVIPGDIVKEWTRDGRRFQEISSGGPKPQRFAIASGTWDVRKAHTGDVEITAYTVPGHDTNLDSMIRGVKDTIAYGNKNFGTFDSKVMRIAEIPSFSDRFGATAYHNTSFAVENRLYLLQKNPNGVDMGYRTLAHEVAHHWWGYQLNPATFEGAHFLTEFLAVYSEGAVYMDHHPRHELMDYLDKTNDLYFYFRGYEDDVEMPLSRVQFQPYIYYMKGAQVAHAMRELMGRERIDAVLRDFLKQNLQPAAPKARDLIPKLIAAAPTEAQAQVEELLTKVVTYNFRLKSSTRRDTTPHIIEATIAAEMTHIAEDGTETTSPMTSIEVGFYKGENLQEIKTLRFIPDQETYTFEVAEAYDDIELDPRRLRLDADREDNRRSIKTLTD